MLKRRWLSIALAVVIGLLISFPILAASQAQPTLIRQGLPVGGLPTSVYGVGSSPINDTFYAQGRNWLFYMNYDSVADDSDLVYTSAEPGGTWETPVVIANDCGLYAIEFAVWYDQQFGKIHYARHNMTPDPDEVAYRMGTPNTDGTITWAAAEQTVATTPADLVTWRTTIAVDEDGYPWVAWIDTNGVDSYGIVYVESSSTKNGTWTQDASISEDFGTADCHAWFVSLTPIESGEDIEVMEVEFTLEDQTGGLHDTEVTLVAHRWDNSGAGSWTLEDTVVAYGSMSEDRPDGFSFYDVGNEMWVAYTDVLGSVLCRQRDYDEAWYEATAANAIKESPGNTLIPTLSGYKASGAGEDIMCIVHHTATLYYSIHHQGDDFDDWDSWQTIWSTSDAEDILSRHVASYKYSSPIAFSWQVTDSSDEPDADDVYYWWIDNDNGQLGYYSSFVWARWLLQMLVPIIIATGLVLSVFGIASHNYRTVLYGVIIGATGFVIIQAFLELI